VQLEALVVALEIGKSDLIAESAVESIIGELQDLFVRIGAGAALSAKAVFKPTKGFHISRHGNARVDPAPATAKSRACPLSGCDDSKFNLSLN
jgi:hypothetical protein